MALITFHLSEERSQESRRREREKKKQEREREGERVREEFVFLGGQHCKVDVSDFEIADWMEELGAIATPRLGITCEK